jgi:hypothetical protein
VKEKKLMKKTLYIGLMFLFVLSLGACAGDKQSAIEVKDAMSKTRFAVSSDGVISDAGTGLEWVKGPDQKFKYEPATNWVTSCKVAGGGWRMPTRRELKTIYLPGAGQNNIDPAFKFSGWGSVWAEPDGPSAAWCFNFANGEAFSRGLNEWVEDTRVLAVRSRPR